MAKVHGTAILVAFRAREMGYVISAVARPRRSPCAEYQEAQSEEPIMIARRRLREDVLRLCVFAAL